MDDLGDRDPRRARAALTAGFTLMELLIVIGILGLLAVVLLPQVLQGRARGDAAATEARMRHLEMAIEGFNRRYGQFPSDSFVPPPGSSMKPTADKTNAGIESLMIFLHEKPIGITTLEDKPDWLANTDGDSNSEEIPLLHTKEKMEAVDAWGTPLAYFEHSSYGTPQEIKAPDGTTQRVNAMKDPRTGKFLAPRGWQLISAGPDGKFETENDNISLPPMPRS